MRRIRRGVAVLTLVGLFGAVGIEAAFADKPGPGDKQCVPGKQGDPHPGHKAGACPNP